MARAVFLVAALVAATTVAVAPAAVPAGGGQFRTAERGGAGPLAVRLSSRRAGATRVAMRLTFQTALRCGVPVGSIGLALPRSAYVPARILTTAVSINGRPPLRVTATGTAITIVSGRAGTMCDSIVDGPALVTINAAAGVGNPARPGACAVRVTHAGERYSGTVVILRR